MKETNVKKQKGVTLIALMITIIVLLISAGVAINALAGENGILKEGKQAADDWKGAEDTEIGVIDGIYSEMEKASNLAGGNNKATSKTLEEKMVDANIQGDIESLVDVVDGVPIPKDFTVSEVVGENKKTTGLVVKDSNDNEFVWVPVKDLEPNGTIDGINYNQKFGRRLFGMSYVLGGATATVNQYTESIAVAITESIEKYGGFYIARYEASDENGKAASKPGTTAWDCVEHSTATKACGKVYSADAKVSAHMVSGAEWDSTLQWFKQTVPEFNNSDVAIGTNSTEWGNYKDISFKYGESLITKNSGVSIVTKTGEITGPLNRHMKNNIYDMAGNINEWTLEKYGTSGTNYAVRGGGWYTDYSGNAKQVAARTMMYAGSDNYSGVGFRMALYIK